MRKVLKGDAFFQGVVNVLMIIFLIIMVYPLLYVGIFSSGVAYTLQIISQKDANPTVITLLLSLESVFAIFVERVIPGAAKGPMMWWEILGCTLIFGAVIISQLRFKNK